MKKYLIAVGILATSLSTMAFAFPPTVTVTINSNNVRATSHVPLASIKVLSVYSAQGTPTEQAMTFPGLPSSHLSEAVNDLNGMGMLTNVYISTPATGYPPAPYYVWFGIYNKNTHQSIYPASCEILLNANKNINSVVIHQNGCIIS